jgi:hypothetical protein
LRRDLIGDLIEEVEDRVVGATIFGQESFAQERCVELQMWLVGEECKGYREMRTVMRW